MYTHSTPLTPLNTPYTHPVYALKTTSFVTRYIHRRRASPYPDKSRFPTWMWRNQCMDDFFEWCKRQVILVYCVRYTRCCAVLCCAVCAVCVRVCLCAVLHTDTGPTLLLLQPPGDTPDLFGMDCYSLFESKRHVVAFLERHDPEFAAEVKDRLAYLDRFETGSLSIHIIHIHIETFHYTYIYIHTFISQSVFPIHTYTYTHSYLSLCFQASDSSLTWRTSTYSTQGGEYGDAMHSY